jgi:hypothetical protein
MFIQNMAGAALCTSCRPVVLFYSMGQHNKIEELMPYFRVVGEGLFMYLLKALADVIFALVKHISFHKALNRDICRNVEGTVLPV